MSATSPNGAAWDGGNPNYGTDPRVVDVAREIMGGIDCDPCTDPVVNSWHIRAPRFYFEHGLQLPWQGRTFCNPPGGKGNDALDWWERGLCQYPEAVTQFFFVSFSLDRLQTSQRSVPLTTFPTFVPAKRLAYLHHDGPLAGQSQKSPPKPSCFTWVPPCDVPRNAAANILGFAFRSQGIQGIVL